MLNLMGHLADRVAMHRGGLWVIGVASLLQLLVVVGVVLFSVFRNEPVPIHIVYASVLGGIGAGALDGSNELNADEGAGLVGDAIVHGSLAALLVTILMFVVQFASNVLDVWFKQGFWAPLIIGVYQSMFFAVHLVSAVVLGALGAVLGFWISKLLSPNIETPR